MFDAGWTELKKITVSREYKMLHSVTNDLNNDQAQSGECRSKTAKTRVSRHRSKRAGIRGQSLIEFTLVMPFLLLVATGMVSFGLALHNDLVLTNAVNTGAQLLAFSRGQTTDPCATATTAITNAAPSLYSGLSLTFVINGTTYSSTTSCTSAASNMVQGATAQVTGSYPCVIAIVGANYPSCTLRSQVTEYIQ